MGEYADDAMERDFDAFLGGLDEYDELCEEDRYAERGPDEVLSSKRHGRVSTSSRLSEFEYTKIIRETEKAWFLEMNAGAQTWFPKSKCKLNEELKLVFVPQWLVDKMIINKVSVDD